MPNFETLPDNAFWRYFRAITQIPHPSEHEARLREYLIAEAVKYGLAYQVDARGNLCIRRAAAPGCEKLPRLILQAHLDMVPQKADGVEFDFLTDPIPMQVVDGVVSTGGKTTLGADDGVGIAGAMELLTDPNLRCGSLQAIFTVEEETGMGGALAISTDWLDADILFNLDSGEELTVGCAGGAKISGSAVLSSTACPADSTGVKIVIQGLHGGHSGEDIHLPCGSACKIAAELLSGFPEMKIASIEAGTLSNAIARSGVITGALANDRAADLTAYLDKLQSDLNDRYIPAPGGKIELDLELTALPETVLTDEAAARLLKLLNTLPHGVLAAAESGATLSSSNLAIIRGRAGEVWCIDNMPRSVDDGERDEITAKIGQLFTECGFVPETGDVFPGWKPDFDSPLIRYARKVFQETMGSEAQILVIHGGLEPGLFSRLNPDLAMLSFGPRSEFFHSPQEKITVKAAERYRRFLRKLVEDLEQY